jgi:hypothetical protein
MNKLISSSYAYQTRFHAITVSDGEIYTYYRFEITFSSQVSNILISRRINVDALQ